MNIDYSKLFSVEKKEVLKGAISAVIASIVVGFYGIVSQSGFDLFSVEWTPVLKSMLNWAFAGFVGSLVEWTPVLKSMLNWAFAGFVGSLGRNFLTTEKGNVLGVIDVK